MFVFCYRYESKRVVLHTDERLMPALKRDWSPLNIIAHPQANAASVTVWMNRIDRSLRHELTANVFQTWNPILEPEKDLIIVDYSFERPVMTSSSAHSLAILAQSQGAGHVWLVGAYSRYSMPLLENGVKSAMEVARALGISTDGIEVDEKMLAEMSDSLWAGRKATASFAFAVLVVIATLLHALYFA